MAISPKTNEDRGAAAKQSISRRDRSGPCALSFSQETLWFLNQLQPNCPAYNQPNALRLKGNLDIDSMRKALNTIVLRHEILRTTFISPDGNPLQVIGAPQSVELPVVELSDISGMAQQAELDRRILEITNRPFDLSRDLMLRAALLQLSATDHVFLLVMYHIVSDGWSVGVFFQELAVLYEALSSGNPSPLPELPIQYADYALWQRQRLQGAVLERHLSYWKQNLAGVPPLELTSDRPRPAIQSFRGARMSRLFPSRVAESLKALARCERASLFMTLLAVFKLLLYRYSSQDDIVIGSPTANRTRVETEDLIGFFVNTLVLRSNLSGNPSFRELLVRIRKTALEAYEHQDIPFEKLVEELHPDRDPSRSPLLQVMFAHQTARRQIRDMGGLSVSPIEIDNGTAKFELSLYTWEAPEGLKATFEYNTDLFDTATITRMLDHFETLLQGVVKNPNQPIADIPILTEAEKHQLLVEWNGTLRDYPNDQCVHQLFEAQVERTPEAVAVVFEEEQLTYRELNARANQLARYLRNLGAGPDILVCICMERSLEMVVALLAILKSGAAYVPLDPAYPSERLAFILEDTQARMLVTQKNWVAEHEVCNRIVVCLDQDRKIIAYESEKNLVSNITLLNLAYVIYTSGSTGKPKGVQISHGAVVNFLSSMREQPGLSEQDILLSVTTLSFDIAALEIFLPLTVGARVEIVNREVAADGARLWERLENSGATAMQATPATWQLLLEAGWRGSDRLKALCGGQALLKELAAKLLARSSCLWNMYGPTETTIWSALYQVSAADRAAPIGRPIANAQIYLLDRHLNPVPMGVIGELYIGGAGVARGYLNRPELTAEKFIPNPFHEDPGARLYKTGDLARYLPSGNIEFLGRVDHQIKLRGHRIELGEIEAVLEQHPGVRDVVVVAHEYTPSDKRLIAYVVPRQGFAPTTGELHVFIKARLPDHMMPGAFVFLDMLPLTTNGKVDRRVLSLPDMSRSDLSVAFVAPRNPAEEVLAVIWSEVLRVDRVGVYDNFFVLGGHSLLAARVISQIRDALQVDVTLRTLFEKPTLAELTEAILNDPVGRDKVDRRAQLFLKLSQLSSDQVETLLSEKRSLLRQEVQ